MAPNERNPYASSASSRADDGFLNLSASFGSKLSLSPLRSPLSVASPLSSSHAPSKRLSARWHAHKKPPLPGGRGAERRHSEATAVTHRSSYSTMEVEDPIDERGAYVAPLPFPEPRAAEPTVATDVVCGLPFVYRSQHGYYTGQVETATYLPHGMGTWRGAASSDRLEGRWGNGMLQGDDVQAIGRANSPPHEFDSTLGTNSTATSLGRSEAPASRAPPSCVGSTVMSLEQKFQRDTVATNNTRLNLDSVDDLHTLVSDYSCQSYMSAYLAEKFKEINHQGGGENVVDDAEHDEAEHSAREYSAMEFKAYADPPPGRDADQYLQDKCHRRPSEGSVGAVRRGSHHDLGRGENPPGVEYRTLRKGGNRSSRRSSRRESHASIGSASKDGTPSRQGAGRVSANKSAASSHSSSSRRACAPSGGGRGSWR